MQRITHIEALTRLATTLHTSATANERNSPPVAILAKHLSLDIKSYRFVRILTWMISFYNDGVGVISKSSLAEKNRKTASANFDTLFSPFLPPFAHQQIGTWYATVMSSTNESYFDLLSDAIRPTNAINLPDAEDISKMINDLRKLQEEQEKVGLPQWINEDFAESIQLTVLVLEKIPFLAHRMVADAHGSILSKLFLTASADQKKFMVKVATTINVVLAAFVMPFEGYEAGSTYYEWFASSPSDIKQIEQVAQPLALPAPKIAKR